MATRPCYTFHSSYSYLYYRILSCYMLSSCTFHILSSCTSRILHIHLYVLILSYALCFRILSVLFLCWLKANTFISYLYFSHYVNFYLIFHISRRSTRLILLHHIIYCHMFSHMLSYTFIFCTVISYTFMCSYTVFLVFVTVYYHRIVVLCLSYHIIYFRHFL